MWVRRVPIRMVRSLTLHVGRYNRPTLYSAFNRQICDKPLLKSESYEKEVKRFRARLTDTDPFWLRVLTMFDEGKVYEEDLKMAWFLAEEEHLPEAIRLTEKYLQDLKATTAPFKYSAIMMRTCARINRSDIALKLFQNPVTSKHLDDAMSIIILMDLLIENGKYNEAADVVDQIQKWEWYFILRNPVIVLLYTIAQYKLGTREALLKAYQMITKTTLRPTHRKRGENIVFLLAIKLKEIEVLQDFIKRPVSSELEWNLKIQGLVILSMWNDVLRETSKQNHRFFEDTYKLILTTNPDFSKHLKQEICLELVEDQLLSPVTLEEFKDVLIETKKRFYL